MNAKKAKAIKRQLVLDISKDVTAKKYRSIIEGNDFKKTFRFAKKHNLVKPNNE